MFVKRYGKLDAAPTHRLALQDRATINTKTERSFVAFAGLWLAVFLFSLPALHHSPVKNFCILRLLYSNRFNSVRSGGENLSVSVMTGAESCTLVAQAFVNIT